MLQSSRTMMPASLEDVFQDINRNFIRLNKQETHYNYVVLHSVLEEVLKLMQDSDKLFEAMKPKLEYMGSYFDGLRVGHATEFDINVVLKLPVYYNKIVLDSANTEYDFTHVKMPSEFRRLYANPVTSEKGFNRTVIWCDRLHRLSVSKFRSWMQSVVEAGLSHLPIENGKRMLKVKDKLFGIVFKLAGPANNLTIYHGNSIIDIDLVPTFAFKLPKIPLNTKVDFSKKEFKSIKTYFVAPKPNSDDFSWRLSFPFQERLLIKNKQNLKSVIKLLKHLRDVQGFTQIASYYIKTLCLWEVIATSETFWEKKSLSYLTLYMVKKFRDALSENRISNFWSPDHNLLTKIKPETCRNWSNRLTHIINNIEKNKIMDPFVVMEYFDKKGIS